MINRSGATNICLTLLAMLASFAAQAESGAVNLKPEYNRWLNEDVRWIISDQERSDFGRLATDSGRDKFVVKFWERRNPTPGSTENAFKEEHYRRLAFANEHFAAKAPGWQTDRGRIYIVYGPPDSIETQPAKDHAEGILSKQRSPYQIWHYNHMTGVGESQNLRFVDACQCGDYKLTSDSLK